MGLLEFILDLLVWWWESRGDSLIPIRSVLQMGQLCNLNPVFSLNFHCVEFAHAVLIVISQGL